MRVLIVEDEMLASDRLQKMLRSIDPLIDIVAVIQSVSESVEWFKSQGNSIDLVFMDIELSDGQCFDIFQQVAVKHPIIFTTSYDEYAIQAFKLNSIDYILKPIHLNDLQFSINKYKNIYHASIDYRKLSEQLINNSLTYRERFLVKVGSKYFSIDAVEIAYFFLEERVTYIKNFKGEKYIIDHTLDDLEKVLNPKHFFRANRQVIVNIRSIAGIQDYFNQKLRITLNPSHGHEVLVSKEKVNLFKTWMGK